MTLTHVRDTPAILPGHHAAIYQDQNGMHLWISTIPMDGKWQEETMAFACHPDGELVTRDELAADRYAGSRDRVLQTLATTRSA